MIGQSFVKIDENQLHSGAFRPHYSIGYHTTTQNCPTTVVNNDALIDNTQNIFYPTCTNYIDLYRYTKLKTIECRAGTNRIPSIDSPKST
ncbi:hypothetical protein ANN_14571 [Periplaneta americana]|uniref:Uncharacterized protein n=1 Tax=Periplaneta americana TaxID=6978 RepID=A0ABQ8SWQ4_PERAM|nr:hypothetical protein ANN_14571 [Periplaneta americana]